MTTPIPDAAAFPLPSPPDWLIKTACQAIVPGTCTYFAHRYQWTIEPSFLAFTIAFCAVRLLVNILETLASNPSNEYAISTKALYHKGKRKIKILHYKTSPYLDAVVLITGFLFAELHKPNSPTSLALYGSYGLLLGTMWTRRNEEGLK